MKNFITLLLPIVIMSSCAKTAVKIKYPLKAKKYSDDRVSVQTAVNLAISSYVKACVDRSIELGYKKNYETCLKKAKSHVKNDIVFFLDEN